MSDPAHLGSAADRIDAAMVEVQDQSYVRTLLGFSLAAALGDERVPMEVAQRGDVR